MSGKIVNVVKILMGKQIDMLENGKPFCISMLKEASHFMNEQVIVAHEIADLIYRELSQDDLYRELSQYLYNGSIIINDSFKDYLHSVLETIKVLYMNIDHYIDEHDYNTIFAELNNINNMSDAELLEYSNVSFLSAIPKGNHLFIKCFI